MAEQKKGFWDAVDSWGPQVASAGLNWYAANQAANESQQRASQVANDPMLGAFSGAAQAELAQMGAVDPAQRFAQQQALLAPVKAKGEADLYRNLYAKGMLGLATDQGAESGDRNSPTWTPNQRANPLAAAYFAARGQQESTDAYNALREADAARSSAASRAAQLAGARSGAQQVAMGNLPDVRKSSGMSGLVQGLTGLLGNKDVMSGITGAVRGLGGSLGGLFGGSGGSGGYGMPSGSDWGMIESSIAPSDYGLGGYNFQMPQQFGMDDLWGNLDYGGGWGDWGGGWSNWGGGESWSF